MEMEQKRTLRMIKTIETISYSKGLKKLILVSLSKRRLWSNLITIYKQLHGNQKSDNRGFLSLTDKNIRKFSAWKLKLGKFRLKKIQHFSIIGITIQVVLDSSLLEFLNQIVYFSKKCALVQHSI